MSWFEEKQSAWLYRRAAQAESNPRIKQLFEQLAEGAEEQAAIWNNDANAVFTPGLRARIVADTALWAKVIKSMNIRAE